MKRIILAAAATLALAGPAMADPYDYLVPPPLTFPQGLPGLDEAVAAMSRQAYAPSAPLLSYTPSPAIPDIFTFMRQEQAARDASSITDRLEPSPGLSVPDAPSASAVWESMETERRINTMRQDIQSLRNELDSMRRR